MTNDPHRPARGNSGEPPHWTKKPEMARKIGYALFGVCALLLAIDGFIHKHGPFAIEHLWGFYGIYGFICCVFLIVAAKGLRAILMRGEDYYDR